jgi:ABC-type polysaccharide/polyol phosphate transport system ATPase subunit
MNAMIQTAGIIVLASHNFSILRATCSHGMVMERGKVAFLGSLDDAVAFYEEFAKKG